MVQPEGYERLNPYSRIIVDEAVRRAIAVEVVDAELGELVLSRDGRRIATIESLSELTSAVAFRRCDDKLHTRRVLEAAGLRVPAGRAATFDERDQVFLRQWKDVVVKPVRGEGGHGVTVGVTEPDALAAALAQARDVWPVVLMEQRCMGADVRVVVIGGEVVAASVREPAAVHGTGNDTVADLVTRLNDDRTEATGGAFKIPVDDRTASVVGAHGWEVDDVLPDGEVVPVRRTPNVHTGGTISDVTSRLHPGLAAVAVRAATAIGIPVVGLDLIVPAVDGPEYTIIEANEQPGLANHEPQPTAERFLDLLFPPEA